jgi:hypothetical protein
VGVCHFLYLIFWCPIIYLDYFWYIKYQHISIYMKMEKRNGKRKRKRKFQLAGLGGISAHPGASARAGALAAQLRSTGGETARVRGCAGATVSLRAHTSARAEGGGRRHGLTARVNRTSAGREPGRRWARRRFAAGGPVLGPWGGGLARAGASDPRGRLRVRLVAMTGRDGTGRSLK